MRKIYFFPLFILTISFLILGCETTSIARYDETAYSQLVSLKVNSLALIDKATEDYSKYVNEIEKLRKEMQFSYEYANGRPKNEITTQQIDLLINPENHLLGGFLKRWEDKGSLSKTFINNAKDLITEAFDQIIGLESGKI